MIRLARVDRASFFDGMTPGWILGAIGYVASVLTLCFLSDKVGRDITPCLLKQSTGLPCPLCGGTRASMSLLSGDPSTALAMNPGVAIALPIFAIWLIFRLGFGFVLRLNLPKPAIISIVVVLALVNWAYTIQAHYSG